MTQVDDDAEKLDSGWHDMEDMAFGVCLCCELFVDFEKKMKPTDWIPTRTHALLAPTLRCRMADRVCILFFSFFLVSSAIGGE